MAIINPFDQSDAFTLVGLTTSVNIIPNVYGRLLRGNIFAEKPIRTTSVVIERQGNILTLLPSMARGGPGSQSGHGKRNMISLTVPHIPVEDVIRPQDFQGVREFGTEASLKTLASVMAGYLIDNKRKFDITWEFLMWGAIKGLIMDGDGVTVLEDLFDRFKIVQMELFFELDKDATDVGSKCRALCRYMEENLLGDSMTGVRVFVSREFFDALVTHPSVVKYFVNWQAAAQAQGRDPRKSFMFEGVVFEEFGGQAAAASGENLRFIEAGQGHAIILTFWSHVDRPLTRRFVETIVDSVNIWLNGLAARERILGGRLEFVRDENPTTDLMDGIARFHLYATPPSPAREIMFLLEYDPSYLQNLFGQD